MKACSYQIYVVVFDNAISDGEFSSHQLQIGPAIWPSYKTYSIVIINFNIWPQLSKAVHCPIVFVNCNPYKHKQNDWFSSLINVIV